MCAITFQTQSTIPRGDVIETVTATSFPYDSEYLRICQEIKNSQKQLFLRVVKLSWAKSFDPI